jgi:hypothetical protein
MEDRSLMSFYSLQYLRCFEDIEINVPQKEHILVIASEFKLKEAATK